MLKKLALAAVAAGCMGSTAMAADLMQPPPPAQVMTSGWDGGYIGGTFNYYTSNFIAGDVVFGGNLTVSEQFLIGAEAGFGGWVGLGGGGTGLEAYIGARAGFLPVDNVLLYGTIGAKWFSVPPSVFYAGVGAEFKATDNVSIRGEIDRFNTGVWQGTVGAFWHF